MFFIQQVVIEYLNLCWSGIKFKSFTKWGGYVQKGQNVFNVSE